MVKPFSPFSFFALEIAIFKGLFLKTPVMSTETFRAVFAVGAAVVGFYLYFFLSASEKVKHLFRDPGPDGGMSMSFFVFSKLTGFITMGLIPAILWFAWCRGDRASAGLDAGFTFRYWYLLAGLPLIAAGFSALTSRNPDTLKYYPEVRLKTWGPGALILSCSAWFLYLLGYEVLFRGILLLPMAAAFGPVPAVAVNIALYSAFHLPKGMGETLGAIPLGLIMCIVALMTGSVLIPFLIHLSLALSTHLFAIRYNREMKFMFRKN